MSKVLSGCLFALLLVTATKADTVRVEVGAGVWNQEPDGYLQYQNQSPFTADEVGYSDENKMYAWLNVKHPIPVLPNIRLEYTPMEFSGTATTDFTYKGTTYSANAKSTLTLDQYDAVLYYNILDNTAWTTIDIGLDIKYIDTTFNAQDSLTSASVNEAEDLALPMAYGRLRFEVPGTGLGLEGDIKYTAYKGSKAYDYRLKADYSFDLSAVELGFEAGYRYFRINIDSNDFSSLDTTGDIDVSGFYAGAMLRF